MWQTVVSSSPRRRCRCYCYWPHMLFLQFRREHPGVWLCGIFNNNSTVEETLSFGQHPVSGYDTGRGFR